MNPPMKTRLIPTIIYLSMVCLLISCQRASVENKQLEDPDLFREAVQNLTDISVYDIFHLLLLLEFMYIQVLQHTKSWQVPFQNNITLWLDS